MQRAGRVWVSGEASPPPLVDGEFADGWLLLGHIAELAPTLRGEPRFAVARVPGETEPSLGVIVDALPADLDGYVVVQA